VTTTSIADIAKVDLDALRRAMDTARADPETAEQLDDMLQERTWFDVAAFAAYSCQFDALRLMPAHTPPCWSDENGDDEEFREKHRERNYMTREVDARRLLRRMLAAGLSRYEPDPMAALEARKRRTKR